MMLRRVRWSSELKIRGSFMVGLSESAKSRPLIPKLAPKIAGGKKSLLHSGLNFLDGDMTESGRFHEALGRSQRALDVAAGESGH